MALWSAWRSILHQSGYEDAAVYKIRLVSKKKARQIPRFLARDKEGLLAIGETNNLKSRLKQFRRAATDGTFVQHSAGNMLHYICRYRATNGLIDVDRLEYCYLKRKDKEAAKKTEERLIKQYVRSSGEVPPLNSTCPNRHGKWT